MKITLFFTILIFTQQNNIFRLNTNEVSILNVSDSLISTLGYFKATLSQANCTLTISKFNENNLKYEKIGIYNSDENVGYCQSLIITEGKVITNTNATYLYVGESYNHSTILTIDDYGVIRLIGSYYATQTLNTMISDEREIDNFAQTTSNKFYFPATKLQVNVASNYQPITNLRSWNFSTYNGVLYIKNQNNVNMNIAYQFMLFKIMNSQIFDINDVSFPAAIFSNITFTPRCKEPRIFFNFKPPYVIVADPYWPILSVYEQGRYKIFSFSYSWTNQVDARNTNNRLFTRNQESVCPPYTFEYRGNCVTTCPFPYYHQMRDVRGYCVLTCQQYTLKNQTSRICSCFETVDNLFNSYVALTSTTIRNCSNDSTPYPYGCYCNQAGLFYDRILTFSCVSTCPNTTFGSNGLCMKCSKNCIICQRDSLFRLYLECKLCETGYRIYKGLCYRQCSPGLGRSTNGSCLACDDQNCINCTDSVSKCYACTLLYVLYEGSCVKNCSSQQLTATNHFSSSCIAVSSVCSFSLPISYKNQSVSKCFICNDPSQFAYQDSCTSSCPSGFTGLVNSFNRKICSCSSRNTLTIGNKCQSILFCPIQMGYDPSTNSCVNCQFGCMTCIGKTCTSCIPGYFLYISPQITSCRRKSPLYPCDQQFIWFQNACILETKFESFEFCLSTVSNCKVCQLRSSDRCILCNPRYYLYNNTCVSSCPAGLTTYNGHVCILLEIINCEVPYLQVKSQSFMENPQKLDKSSPYNHYVIQAKNDPVGFTYNYDYDPNQILNINKYSEFFYPSWICLKCVSGYGLNADFKTCLPCPSPCLECYMARSDSCLSISNQGCGYYIDERSGICVENCSLEGFYPNYKNNILYCSPSSSSTVQLYNTLDCGLFKNDDGTIRGFCVFLDPVKGNVNPQISKMASQPSSVAANLKVGSSIRSSPSNIQFYDTSQRDSNKRFYMLVLAGNINNYQSVNGLAFSNTVYGVSTQQSHPQFMKSWLAFIGYVMSITIIALHCIFIGNNLLYKVDNTLILAQSIYLFSFVQLLVGKLLAQFYYGWIYAHFGFFPNLFFPLIPSNYYQNAAPNSYKLATMDANVVRNAGFAFSLLLIFIGAFLVVAIICWIIGNLCGKSDIWHPKIAKNSFVGAIQFISMIIFYWSVANLLYIKDANLTDPSFYVTSQSVSGFFIALILLYSIIRWFYNPLGGLYMFKRIIISSILAYSYQYIVMLAPLLFLQVVFMILRFVLEKPQKKKEKIYILAEYLIHSVVYILLFLVLDAGVNTIIISIIMFVLIVSLAYDLTDVYLESQNEWPYEQVEQEEQKIAAKNLSGRRAQTYRQ